MSREVKFRAWDGSCMYTQDNCYFTFGKDEKGVGGKYWSCYLYKKSGGDYCCDSTDEDVVLMQYIGQNDFKNNPIFEGDILRLHFGDGSSCLKIVKYNEEKCAFNICNVTDLQFEHAWDIWGQIGKKYLTDFNMEVIGNIYENANLLAKI